MKYRYTFFTFCFVILNSFNYLNGASEKPRDLFDLLETLQKNANRGNSKKFQATLKNLESLVATNPDMVSIIRIKNNNKINALDVLVGFIIDAPVKKDALEDLIPMYTALALDILNNQSTANESLNSLILCRILLRYPALSKQASLNNGKLEALEYLIPQLIKAGADQKKCSLESQKVLTQILLKQDSNRSPETDAERKNHTAIVSQKLNP